MLFEEKEQSNEQLRVTSELFLCPIEHVIQFWHKLSFCLFNI